MVLITVPLVFTVVGCSSVLQAIELTCSIGVKRDIKSAFFLNSYCVVLLRHCMSMRKLVAQRKSGRLSDGIREELLLSL
jgi:hypothetical protein